MADVIEAIEASEEMKAQIHGLCAKMLDLGLCVLAKRAGETFMANLTLAKNINGGCGASQEDVLAIFRGYRDALSEIIEAYEDRKQKAE